MVLNWISSRTGPALPLIAIGLALANWNARPAEAWAWAAVIVIAVVMVAVQRLFQRALSRSPGDAAAVRSADSVASAVVFGALMMIIPLALTLAHTYGLVDDPDSGMRRMIMIMSGAYLAMTGNALPRMLPPTSSVPSGWSGARVQAFQRRAGWTWTLCGLGFAMTGLALPIDALTPISLALFATAMIVTIVQLLRLRKPRPHAPRLN